MSAGVLAKRGLLLAVTGVSLYLLAPALLEVFGAYDRLDDFNPLWWIAMVLLQIGSYACMWEVQKISMRADHHGPVITSQPASSVLVFGILLALPLLALPAVLFGAPVDPGLGKAALIGGVMFVLLFAAGAAAILWDRPLVLLGRAAQTLRNRIRPGKPPRTGLPDRLLRERNSVTMVLGQRWWQALLLAAGRWLLDYLTLLAALTAVHADPRPSTVLLAYCAAQFLGTLPLTPGGLGFVEAGLTGTLALAGVPAGAAVVATLAYRLVSFWLPIPAGGVAALLHRRHYGEIPESTPA